MNNTARVVIELTPEDAFVLHDLALENGFDDLALRIHEAQQQGHKCRWTKVLDRWAVSVPNNLAKPGNIVWVRAKSSDKVREVCLGEYLGIHPDRPTCKLFYPQKKVS